MPTKLFRLIIAVILLFGTTFYRGVLAAECDSARTSLDYEREANDYSTKNVHFLAIKSYTCALKQDDDNASLYLYRGNEYRYVGEYDAAIDDLNRSLKLDPKRNYILFSIGLIYFEAHDYEKSIEYLNRYINRDESQLPTVYLSVGMVYAALNRQKEAIAAFDQYLSLAPNDPLGHAEKGFALKAFGKNELGEESLRQARFIDRNAGKQYLIAAQLALGRSDVEEGLIWLNKAILLSPDLRVGYIERAFIYLLQNKIDLLHKDCENIQLNAPSSKYNDVCNSIISIINGDWQESLRWIDEAIDLDIENPALYGMRAYIYSYLKNYDAALADLDTAIKFDPYCNFAYFLRAVIYESKNDYSKALADYEYFLELRGGGDRNSFLADHISQLEQLNQSESPLLLFYSSHELASLMLQYPIFPILTGNEQGTI